MNMKIRRLLLSTALPAAVFATALPALAQTEVTDARTANVSTSTEGANNTADDVTITSTGTVTVTTGAGVTLDSDNDIVNDGTITTIESSDTVGILVSGARTGSVTNNSVISLLATPISVIAANGDITVGSGRVGILISGASPFTGNIENSSTGNINIRGQNSAGIRLEQGSSMTGDIIQAGGLSVFGRDTIGIDVAGDIIGNLAVSGPINALGGNTQAVNVGGDVTGSIVTTAQLIVTGFVEASGRGVTARQSLISRVSLEDTGSIRQAGSAFQVNGNVTEGIHFSQTRDATTNGLLSISGITMAGSAPAVLIDGEGTPIAIGIVGQIIDPNDEDFDADLQFAFVNQGNLFTDGILDDVDATTFELRDAQLTGGFNNIEGMRATVYRSAIDPAATGPTHDSHARVIVIGGGGIAERINNSGVILARGFEAIDSAFVDFDNPLAPNRIFVTAIDVAAGGSLTSLTNTGSITALITSRRGEAVAVRDASGTLIEINNSGTLGAQGVSSDVTGASQTDFVLIAIDVTANTAGFTLNQTVFTDAATGNSTTPVILGDILLGSGDDFLNIAAGTINGNISFGDGADRLTLAGSSVITGTITDTDGALEILITDNSRLAISGPDDINVATFEVDGTSTYSPFINPENGDVSVLTASGTATFQDGAVIDPRLSTVLDNASTSFTILNAGTLAINGDINTLRGENSPFLYNTSFDRDPNDPNSLIMTLDLRSTTELGLDVQQAAAFTSAFEALQTTDDLGSAFVGLTDQTSFNAAYNQLLPEFAAAARQFVLANVDGSVGAVGSHLNNARRSQDEHGGLWIEEFAYFADRSLAGLSEQYRGFGFGITGGIDSSFGPFHTVGINAGFATTEIEDVLGIDEPLDVLSLQGGVYAGYEAGNFGLDLYAGGGYDDFEANRNIQIGNFTQTARGDWSATHYNASATAGYDLNFGKYYMRPSASFTYLSMSEQAYTEEGSASIALAIDKRTSSIGTASAVLDFGARFEGPRSWWAPSIRVGYRNNVIDDRVVTTGRFVGGTTPFTIENTDFPGTGMVLGVTFAMGSKYAAFSLDYDAELRDGFSRHTARLVLRLLF